MVKYHGKVWKNRWLAKELAKMLNTQGLKDNGKLWKKHVKQWKEIVKKWKTSQGRKQQSLQTKVSVRTQALLWICCTCHLHVLAERQSRALVGVLNTDEAWQLKRCETIWRAIDATCWLDELKACNLVTKNIDVAVRIATLTPQMGLCVSHDECHWSCIVCHFQDTITWEAQKHSKGFLKETPLFQTASCAQRKLLVSCFAFESVNFVAGNYVYLPIPFFLTLGCKMQLRRWHWHGASLY